MKRDADNNRIWRAMSNIESAVNHIDSIKSINRTEEENKALNECRNELQYIRNRLRVIEKGGEE